MGKNQIRESMREYHKIHDYMQRQKHRDKKQLIGAEMVVDRWHGYLLSLSKFWVLEIRVDDVNGS